MWKKVGREEEKRTEATKPDFRRGGPSPAGKKAGPKEKEGGMKGISTKHNNRNNPAQICKKRKGGERQRETRWRVVSGRKPVAVLRFTFLSVKGKTQEGFLKSRGKGGVDLKRGRTKIKLDMEILVQIGWEGG